MIIDNFYSDVLKDYEANLDVFFDRETNAVFEPGREDGAPRFLFTEVTGYALLDFLLLYSITGDEAYIDRANRAATWIAQCAQDECGGVLTRYYFEHDKDDALADKSFAGRRIYSFDTAICLRGMVAIYNHTGNESYLSSAVRMGDFLVDRMIDDKGMVAAIYDARQGRCDEPNTEVWSRCFGAFHSKVGEALVDLAETTGDERYERAATALCSELLRFQSQAGNFETSRGGTELHPHCYATEGLLHVGRMTSNERFIESAERATVWALDRCEDGEIAQSFEFDSGKPLSRFRTDALAQVLALGSDLLQMGRLDTKYRKVLDELAAKILGMKLNGDGYYRYGFYEREFRGKFESNTRSYWTNMFCLRGFFKYYLSSIIGQTYIALLAGGIGSRVWPISCENRPKPVSRTLLGNHSHLQETIRRYTHDYFIPPERIFILCSENAMEQTMEQAGQEGVPAQNCIIEHEPKGTIPAVSLALQGIAGKNDDEERFIIVTMSDNVISPYKAFQGAVANALFTVREKDCLVSIGKPVETGSGCDERFGHMLYENKIENYHAYEVHRFIEKPRSDEFHDIKALPGKLAWECGGVIFREGYYRKVVEENPQSGNLAENLLSRARPWTQAGDDGFRLAAALLGPDVRFEDFGVPGLNLMRFYEGDARYDRGNGNICLGDPVRIKLLSCANNLVISDQLPIEVYGVEGFVIIDNSVTNTAVIMPIEEVSHLPGLYRLFSGSDRYEPFISGGAAAHDALPTTFVEKSPNAQAHSEYGLVFAYHFGERLSIHRDEHGLKIFNAAYPPLDPVDFELLTEKQGEDPRLAEHLVHVGALANAFLGSGLVVSDAARNALNMLALYHDYGGYLNEEVEEKERAMIREFEHHTRLDRRLLDSRIILEIIRSYDRDANHSGESIVSLLNDNVNSAVEFLRKRRIADGDLRDLVVTLLQIQDSPHLYAAYRRGYEGIGLPYSGDEVEIVFSCFKIAENISNGRWLWKRRKFDSLGVSHQGLLANTNGWLEDFPFIVCFSIEWFREANIEPRRFIERLNALLADDESSLRAIIDKIQEGVPLLLCDEIYLELIRKGEGLSAERLQEMSESMIGGILGERGQEFQLTQFLELPARLAMIESCCNGLSADAVETVKEVVAEVYHRNWKAIKPHVSPRAISRLLS